MYDPDNQFAKKQRCRLHKLRGLEYGNYADNAARHVLGVRFICG